MTFVKHEVCAGMTDLPLPALQQVAATFQVLAEPTRLQILNLLRQEAFNVGALAQRCGCSSANVSRHLALLVRHGFVAREARGTAVHSRIADTGVYALCDLVCGCVARRHAQEAHAGAAFDPSLRSSFAEDPDENRS